LFKGQDPPSCLSFPSQARPWSLEFFFFIRPFGDLFLIRQVKVPWTFPQFVPAVPFSRGWSPPPPDAFPPLRDAGIFLSGGFPITNLISFLALPSFFIPARGLPFHGSTDSLFLSLFSHVADDWSSSALFRGGTFFLEGKRASKSSVFSRTQAAFPPVFLLHVDRC